jgi:hypothetical protein
MGTDLHSRRGLTEPLGLANRSHGLLAGRGLESVDEDDAIEVIRLVLHAACQQVAALKRHRLTVHGEPRGHDPLCATGIEGQAGQGEAPLLAILGLTRQLELGIDQVPDDVIDPIREYAQGHPDLRRSQAGTGGVLHGVDEIRDEPAQVPIETLHGSSWLPEHGVRVQHDRSHGHGGILERPGTCALTRERREGLTWIDDDVHHAAGSARRARRLRAAQLPYDICGAVPIGREEPLITTDSGYPMRRFHPRDEI